MEFDVSAFVLTLIQLLHQRDQTGLVPYPYEEIETKVDKIGDYLAMSGNRVFLIIVS